MRLERIYFISDVHIGATGTGDATRQREDVLIDFLRSIRGNAEALYIVGDLFDFWFEYRTTIPSSGARVLFELYNLVQSGVRVIYLPGNHDLWPGDYFSGQLGVELPGGPITVAHQGLRIHVAHGDEIRTDWRFRISRGILKNRFCVGLFRLLHPDLGAVLASYTSRLSEYRIRRRGSGNRDILYRAAREKIAQGVDVVIHGHYHFTLHARVGGSSGDPAVAARRRGGHTYARTERAGELVVLGDWIQQCTYAVLEEGGIRLNRWKAGTLSEQAIPIEERDS